MRANFRTRGWQVLRNLPVSQFHPGDVLLNDEHHTAMYVGNGQIAMASIDEHGHASGGAPGDQTGRETLVRSYYNKPWSCVLRFHGTAQPGTPGVHTGEYIVKAGDNLSSIASKLLGDGNKWHDIYNANKGTIGPNPKIIVTIRKSRGPVRVFPGRRGLARSQPHDFRIRTIHRCPHIALAEIVMASGFMRRV